MAKKPESKFKERVMKDLKELPYMWVLKTQERSRRGTPDLLICMGGDFVALELKTNKGKLDKIQMVTLDKIIKAGGIAMVTTPDQWDHHLSILKAMRNSNETWLPTLISKE